MHERQLPIYLFFSHVPDFSRARFQAYPSHRGYRHLHSIGLILLKDRLYTASRTLLTWLRLWLLRHPKGVTGVLAAVLLLSGGAYALASAVVSFAPDMAQLPTHEVIEPVTPLPLEGQFEALDGSFSIGCSQPAPFKAVWTTSR